MAELTRQSSRERFMIDLLTNQVGFSKSVAEKYAPGLVAEGFDTETIFLGMSQEELRDDFGWKKGHVRKFELYLAERAALAPTAQSGGGSAHDSAETAAPVGSQLADGSTLTLTEKVIGRGASGIVREAILARRSGDTEAVAAKILATGASEREIQKFAKEYDLSVAAAQQCSGTCRIYGCVRVEGALCLVMKRYQGDLAQKLDGRRDASKERQALPLREAHAYLLQIAQSLVELHAMGIVCADLKPSNLLEDETGRLVVADFGIALLAEATLTSTASHTGSGGGAVFYMAPEQHDSEQFGKVTPKADIWAWACIAVEMLSGAAPWSGKRSLEISVCVAFKKHTPTIPPGVPDWLSALLLRSFSHAAAQRPTASEVATQLAANAGDLLEATDPDRGLSLATRDPGTAVYMHADALLQSSWTKREHYEFLRLTEVQEVDNPVLQRRYEQYKQQIAPSDTPGAANEQLVFHGCAEDAIPAILERGFLKSFWKSAAGSWQRFGPGFYFALQASKSHEYPLGLMQALQPGEHSRKMLLCKVAKGNVLQTRENMDMLTGAAPAGYHSVHGIAEADGPLNFDELVVFDEGAVLPYAIVTYRFIKKRADARSDSQLETPGIDKRTFVAAVDSGDVDMVRHYLSQGADPNLVDDGFPVIYSAAQEGHADVVSVLIDAGGEPSVTNLDGAPAVVMASQNGHGSVLRVLIDAGVAMDATDPEDGFSALFWAASKGHESCLRTLLDAGARFDGVGTKSQTALYLAATSGHVGCVRMLLDSGADQFVKTRWGTPLEAAIRKGHDQVVAAFDSEPEPEPEPEPDPLRASIDVLKAAGTAYASRDDLAQRNEAHRLYKEGYSLLGEAMQSTTSTRVKEQLGRKARGVEKRIKKLQATGATRCDDV